MNHKDHQGHEGELDKEKIERSFWLDGFLALTDRTNTHGDGIGKHRFGEA